MREFLEIGAISLPVNEEMLELIRNNETPPSLNFLYSLLSDEQAIRLAKALEDNNVIEELVLGVNRFSHRGIIPLCRVIENNNTLVSLDLSRNQINAQCASAIKNLLINNTTLKKLDLNSNQIGPFAAMLAKGLKSNSTLKELNLSRAEFDNTSILALASCFINESKLALKKLDLSSNKINGECAAVLLENLGKHTSLTSLNFRYNNLGAKAGVSLASLLENEALRTLDLTGNNLGNEGIKCITKALKNNSTLEELILTSNNIGPEGIIYFAEALKQNKIGVKKIVLACNNFGKQGTEALADALRENTTLLELNLESCNIDTKIMTEALRTSTGNYSILKLEGINDPDILSLTKRNQKIKEYWRKDFLLTQAPADVEKSLQTFETLIPEFNQAQVLDDYSISFREMAERHRLLTAYNYMRLDEEKNAFDCLLTPFETPQLRDLAEKALLLLLRVSESFTPQTQIARYQFILILLNKNLADIENQKIAYYALARLYNEGKEVGFAEVSDLKNTTALLNYQEVLTIAKKALKNCTNREEEFLGDYLLEGEEEYHPLTVQGFWLCPSFLKELKLNYPNAKNFQILETCLVPLKEGESLHPLTIPEELPTEAQKLDLEPDQIPSFNLKNSLENLKQRIIDVSKIDRNESSAKGKEKVVELENGAEEKSKELLDHRVDNNRFFSSSNEKGVGTSGSSLLRSSSRL